MKKENDHDYAPKYKPYDRTLREWAGNAFLPIMAQRIAIPLASLEALDTQFAKTIENRADILLGLPKKEPTKRGKKTYEMVLHGEIESQNLTQAIVYRMLMYFTMIVTQFKAPVWQFVFYIGNERLRTPRFLQSLNYSVRFDIIDVKTIPHQTFLEMGTTEGLILSILSDWGNIADDEKVKTILSLLNINYQTKKIEEIELKKALSDLFIFSNLRNLRDEFTKQYQHMAFSLDFVKIEGTIWEAEFERQLTPKIEEKLTKKFAAKYKKIEAQAEAQAQQVKAQAEAQAQQVKAQAEAQVQQAEAQVQQAEAQVQQAEAQVQQAEAAAQAQKEAEKRQTIIRALQRKKLTIDEIVEDFNVSKSYVLAIQKEL